MWFFLYEIHLKISQTLQMLTLSEFVVRPQEIIIAGLKWIVKIKIKRPGQISHIIGGNGKKYLQFSKRSDWRVFKEFYFLLMFSHHGKIVNDYIVIESDMCCKRVDIFYIRLERNRKVDNLPVCVCCASVAQVRSDLLSDFQIRSEDRILSFIRCCVSCSKPKKHQSLLLLPQPHLAHDWRIILSINAPSCRMVTKNGRFRAFLNDIELSIEFYFLWNSPRLSYASAIFHLAMKVGKMPLSMKIAVFRLNFSQNKWIDFVFE